MANQLRKRRKELGFTLEEVAQAIGTTKATIMKLEKGQMNLTESWMKRLAAPLQCDPADLIAEEWPADVPLIGVVSLADKISLYRDLPEGGLGESRQHWEGLEVVERPPEGGYRDVVAMQIQSDEYEPFLSIGSLVYAADPIEKYFQKYLNQIVLCRQKNGVMSLKKLLPSAEYGCFSLASISGKRKITAEIDWCAKVIFFKPS